ncbi:MBL fold metallo-hydrolase [Paenibacillus frigoriresistens]|uniref:MBL fold metallo-hydrolase n=1 Tax=Paenibacillus alginolyticus TaxID=59839 RepID=UPI001565A2FD|nr:MBL fold metallo-hydrolase [Paenibacillus frigoriresistens]NRF92874.1 MBL fold metallo-hydrolase [Paenibacillus frigoriresistens]
MQATLYALNVGRGDSFFVEIPMESRTSIILIDGGDDFIDEKVQPIRFIQEKGWKQIDLMILTHIHPDHLTGLLEVAEHIVVREAILPYPEITAVIGEMKYPKAVQTVEMLRMYKQLREILERQNTRITLRPPFGEKTEWQFGDFKLRHLDPVEKNDLPAFNKLEALQLASVDLQEKLCMDFDELSNVDSSIWLLEDAEGAHLVLFAGDALISNLERIAEREFLRPHGFKVGHHGMLDAWNEQVLRLFSPEWLIITNHRKEFDIFGEAWIQLSQCSDSGLFVTGSEASTYYLVSRLPLMPERIGLL